MTDKKDTPTIVTKNPTEEMVMDILDMADVAAKKSPPTTALESPTGKTTGKKYSPIKKAKNPTEKKPVQHNKIKQEELVKWTVFVQQETKTAVGLAIEKAGITVTDWIDSRLREAATAELTKKTQPPAKPEDMVKAIVEQFADRMKADQEAAQKAQDERMQQQEQQIAALAETVKNSQPKSLKEMIFGKSKKD